MGKEVSFETSSTDGFGDTLAGVASQMAAAINNAGISGISAAKTASANTVTLTADVETGNAVVNNAGNANFISTTLGEAATSVISISGTDTFVGAPTAATYANGDAYTFEVAGQEVRLVIDTADCYLDTKEGVSRQMKDLVDDLNIEGLVVAVDDGTSAGLSITRVMTGRSTAAANGSTVMTNISSLAADEVGEAVHSGSIDVSTSAGAADAMTRIDAALLQINSQRAELGAVSNRMDHTINNLSNVSSNLQSGLSRIQDADFAKVTGDLTKSQIMSQAATAMLAQANASKQGVLSLLQG
jgi:flagellin